MSEMVERVARKMMIELTDDSGFTYAQERPDLSCVVIDGNIDLIALARAAIEAMREPTQTMVAAAEALSREYDAGEIWVDIPPDPEDAWSAMIGAALKESEPASQT
jgi:N-methylhydantoinase B/oxoprolinase/acetone carboxylase alpha subunit